MKQFRHGIGVDTKVSIIYPHASDKGTVSTIVDDFSFRFPEQLNTLCRFLLVSRYTIASPQGDINLTSAAFVKQVDS
jgi:hypothetical protein